MVTLSCIVYMNYELLAQPITSIYPLYRDCIEWSCTTKLTAELHILVLKVYFSEGSCRSIGHKSVPK